MYKFILCLICFFALAGVAHPGWFSEKMWGTKGAAERMNNEEAGKLLREISNDMNKSLPMMVDKETELLTTYGNVLNGERQVYYFYRFVNYREDTYSNVVEINRQRSRLKNSVCTQKSMETLRTLKTVYYYNYSNMNRKQLFEIKINSNTDCR